MKAQDDVLKGKYIKLTVREYWNYCVAKKSTWTFHIYCFRLILFPGTNENNDNTFHGIVSKSEMTLS